MQTIAEWQLHSRRSAATGLLELRVRIPLTARVFVSCNCYDLCRYQPLTWAHHSFIGHISCTFVCVCVCVCLCICLWSINSKNVAAYAWFGLLRHKKQLPSSLTIGRGATCKYTQSLFEWYGRLYLWCIFFQVWCLKSLWPARMWWGCLWISSCWWALER